MNSFEGLETVVILALVVMFSLALAGVVFTLVKLWEAVKEELWQ